MKEAREEIFEEGTNNRNIEKNMFINTISEIIELLVEEIESLK